MDKEHPEVLSVPEAGRVFGLSREAAYAAARRGDLPVIRFGRRIVVPRRALIRLLEEGGRCKETAA